MMNLLKKPCIKFALAFLCLTALALLGFAAVRAGGSAPLGADTLNTLASGLLRAEISSADGPVAVSEGGEQYYLFMPAGGDKLAVLAAKDGADIAAVVGAEGKGASVTLYGRAAPMAPALKTALAAVLSDMAGGQIAAGDVGRYVYAYIFAVQDAPGFLWAEALFWPLTSLLYLALLLRFFAYRRNKRRLAKVCLFMEQNEDHDV